MTKRKGDWRQTYTGRQYWPLDPRASDVCAEDIAHHLSQMVRYAGAARRFYSIAEHSVGVMALVACEMRRRKDYWPPALLFALLHDGSEAYCQDIIRPIKYEPEMAHYLKIEALNSAAINEHFGDFEGQTCAEWAHVIKLADNAMLTVERALLLLPTQDEWRLPEVPPVMLADGMTFLEGRPTLPAEQAKALFLDMLDRLA